MSHRRWTAAEVERLREMRAGGSTYGAIARELRRTSGSVASKAHRLGLGTRRRRAARTSGFTAGHAAQTWILAQRLGLPGRLARVAVLVAAGYRRAKIAQALGLKSSTLDKYFLALNDYLGLTPDPARKNRLDLIKGKVEETLKEEDHENL